MDGIRRLIATVALAFALPASATDPPPRGNFETIDWQALRPVQVEAGDEVRALGLALVGDDDPRARVALLNLKESWGRVPVRADMDRRRIWITGFVVMLGAGEGPVHEFLLVPYFGACIHTPPPPPNQVIHVSLPANLQRRLSMMDRVAVGGIVGTVSSDHDVLRSGYTLSAEFLEPLSNAQSSNLTGDTEASQRVLALAATGVWALVSILVVADVRRSSGRLGRRERASARQARPRKRRSR